MLKRCSYVKSATYSQNYSKNSSIYSLHRGIIRFLVISPRGCQVTLWKTLCKKSSCSTWGQGWLTHFCCLSLFLFCILKSNTLFSSRSLCHLSPALMLSATRHIPACKCCKFLKVIVLEELESIALYCTISTVKYSTYEASLKAIGCYFVPSLWTVLMLWRSEFLTLPFTECVTFYS